MGDEGGGGESLLFAPGKFVLEFGVDGVDPVAGGEAVVQGGAIRNFRGGEGNELGFDHGKGSLGETTG